MNKEQLLSLLESEGYREIREVPGQGLCGVMPFIFTIGVCCGLDESGYKYRYCFPQEKALDALLALKIWDGQGDISGPWIKRKGDGGDKLNPWNEATHQ